MEIALSISPSRTFTRWLGVAVSLTMFPVNAQSVAEMIVIDRLDGSPINLLIERPEHEVDVPIVLFIDGSGCESAKREGFQGFSRLPDAMAESAAKVFVDKSGVDSNVEGSGCSQKFLDYYSIDQRVLDHLRAIQYLRRNAAWWNGEIYLVGWSDGAMIGVSVAAYTPEVTRAVFLALGGGIPMTREFEDFSICAPDRTETREACIENLGEAFDDIRANPSPQKTWFGDANSHKAWATRLDAVAYHLIKDFRIPILIIHGEDDRDSVPVESARELIRMLTEEGGVDFEYWEIPDAGHNVGILNEGQSESVRIEMLNWLFKLTSGIGGPPGFGRPLGE